MTDMIARQVKSLELRTEKLIADIELGIKVSDDNVTNPPTDAEIDSAFGAASTLYNGFTGIIDDNGAGTAVYLCIVKDSAWWYQALTKAV